ncbi:acyltransferase [Mesonia sp. K4-1]|jgi:1-acyl-sn-glycerol-3-phosphate acyltransferase|uniref:1-acyl-sn-glycerol-3-phosphate acyltransferase n=2 Tax=Mesonia TaxID=232115 RepID=A0A2W7I1K8_9FLAO|nr:1-acyl-sn-glycerol-3-phosphate acyltransferase [Mesonia algae]PZW40624.1 1-acyl-sn-glycerol-3-phosphate acyltransferase [Mesonia algae]TXK72995.1 acyltransferase [Mesonia sp. K4-1]
MVNYIFNKIMGWKIEGEFDPSIKKSVIIVVPHTSWHDFYIGVFTRSIVKIPIDFVGKKELFKWPFGAYFRWMGGTPLDRSNSENKVEAIAKIFAEKEEFRLSLAPEGTRKKVLNWKTGFYYIALAANVPIIPVGFDYGRKVVKIGEPFYPTKNYEKDLRLLQLFFKDIKGKADL